MSIPERWRVTSVIETRTYTVKHDERAHALLSCHTKSDLFGLDEAWVVDLGTFELKELHRAMDAWVKKGELIQYAFPALSAGTREEILTPPSMRAYTGTEEAGDE